MKLVMTMVTFFVQHGEDILLPSGRDTDEWDGKAHATDQSVATQRFLALLCFTLPYCTRPAPAASDGLSHRHEAGAREGHGRST